MVAAEDAKPARVDRETLVEAELGREVRDAEALVLLPAFPPRRALELGCGGCEQLLYALYIFGRQTVGEVLVRELREQRRRVVVERGEALRVEVGEECARAGEPAEREVAGNDAESLTKRGGTVDHVM
jgi:hypothetical protein